MADDFSVTDDGVAWSKCVESRFVGLRDRFGGVKSVAEVVACAGAFGCHDDGDIVAWIYLDEFAGQIKL